MIEMNMKKKKNHLLSDIILHSQDNFAHNWSRLYASLRPEIVEEGTQIQKEGCLPFLHPF